MSTEHVSAVPPAENTGSAARDRADEAEVKRVLSTPEPWLAKPADQVSSSETSSDPLPFSKPVQQPPKELLQDQATRESLTEKRDRPATGA